MAVINNRHIKTVNLYIIFCSDREAFYCSTKDTRFVPKSKSKSKKKNSCSWLCNKRDFQWYSFPIPNLHRWCTTQCRNLPHKILSSTSTLPVSIPRLHNIFISHRETSIDPNNPKQQNQRTAPPLSSPTPLAFCSLWPNQLQHTTHLSHTLDQL